uniref:Verrucotoxin subunit beta-like n=1 Tax=Sparus aurata TaxID=8175 RepID=A0A671X115_SPAAU
MGSADSNTIEVAALGRPFSLGMLYNCRRDLLIPGMTLWDHDDLVRYIRERRQHYSAFEIVASESIDDKTSALDVSASLKASFLAGTVEVGGAAKYLNHDKKSKKEATVTLKYEATTKFEQLSMDHLGAKNVKYLDDFKEWKATHVVTGILYGAKAFFVFNSDVSSDENCQKVEGMLKVMVKKIPSISIGGEGSLKMKTEEKESVEKFSCNFHGDFLLDKTPSSFQDAVKVYQSLTKLLGANGENAVPVKVWLLPLIQLHTSAPTVVREVSPMFIEEMQAVLENLKEVEMRCNDALKTAAQQFSEIGRKIKTFKDMCSGFKLEFQQKLAKKLPAIRGGGEEENNVFKEILKKIHSSPFNSKDLNEWMECKEREIYTLNSFTSVMKNTKIIPSQSDVNKEILSADHAVCFFFTSLGSHEPYLSALSKHLGQTPKPEETRESGTHDVEKEQWNASKEVTDEMMSKAKVSSDFAETSNENNPHKPDNPKVFRTGDVEREKWYASKKVTDAMRHKAKLFGDFAEANKENKHIKFLAAGSTDETQEGSSIVLYENGFPVTENFEPPSKPETLTVGDINHNSVTLKISPAKFGAENITSYSVEYCVSGQDGWIEKTIAEDEEVTVSDLSPNTEYKFRCRAVTSVGVGPTNEVSGSIKTSPCSSPGEPQDEPDVSERPEPDIPEEKALTMTGSGSDKTSPCSTPGEPQDEPDVSERPEPDIPEEEVLPKTADGSGVQDNASDKEEFSEEESGD